MRSGTRSILFPVCLLLVFAATVWATTNTIQVFNFGFGPTNATINVGDTVQWVWASGITSHSTTAATNQLENWDTGLHTQPFTFSRTFNNVGTFGYYCSSHGFEAHCGNGSGMSGHIIVVSPGATAHRVTAVGNEGNDIRVSWITGGLCKTNALQRATGAADGSYTNGFTDIFLLTNTVGNTTNYLDVGAATNFPASYYRVRLVQ